MLRGSGRVGVVRGSVDGRVFLGSVLEEGALGSGAVPVRPSGRLVVPLRGAVSPEGRATAIVRGCPPFTFA